MIKYTPHSHFFTDLSSLADANISDQAAISANAFGPVKGSETTKYRVTSKVKAPTANSIGKLYAICNGKILIQPQNDPDKLNIIIKPSENNYSPLKIKYFIYRGVNRADYFTNNILNQPDTNKPEILNKMWLHFMALNGLSSITGITFPSDSVFQFTAPATTLIDNSIQSSLITCKEGDYLGNFTGEVGLDIVLDYGDYTIENQVELFSFNLAYARANEFVFDTSTQSDNGKKKIFKENIHQFLDAAAFWGSHINCGEIKYKDGTLINDISKISLVLKKYQTANKLYIYLQDNGRSYNYYDSSRKIYGFNITTGGVNNETNGWPILIKESTSDIDLLVEYHIDYNAGTGSKNINDKEKQISLELISGKGSYLLKRTGDKDILFDKGRYAFYELNVKDTSVITVESGTLPSGMQLFTTGPYKGQIVGTPSVVEVKTVTYIITETDGKVRKEKLKFYINALDVSLKVNVNCADFTLINCNMIQKFPLQNYYDNLWTANIKSSIQFDPSNKMYWTTFDKNRNINLNDIIGENAILQNKVVFDKGYNKVSGTSKKRRLFIATIKRNTGSNQELENLNVDKVTSAYVKDIKDKDVYFSNLFNETDFSIYRGELSTGGNTIKTLGIFNESSLSKKYSYMLLGITEDEYNKFIIPTDANNVFFNLEEISVTDNENIRKFKLGIRYEQVDTNGAVSFGTFYPTPSVEIYSLDDLFFFSKDFSDYQEFYNEFAPLQVEFRTIPQNIDPNPLGLVPYEGEFGFDWLRNGDNYYKSKFTTSIVPDVDFYSGIKGGYERPQTISDNSEYETAAEALKFLIRQYPSIPTKASANNKGIYSVPYLSLFSEEFKVKNPYSLDADSDTPPSLPTEATLRVLITNPAPAKSGTLKFVCDKKDVINFDKQTIVSLQDNTKKQINLVINIKCLKDLAEPINIKVLYFPTGKDINNNKNGLLAGLIILNRNNDSVRKQINIALFNCETDIDPVVLPSTPLPQLSKFNKDDKEMLFKVFHQMLIIPKIKINILDLKTNNKFIINQPGTFVFKVGTSLAIDYNQYLDIFKYLNNIIPNGDNKSLKLYSFGLRGRKPGSPDALAGIAGGIGGKQAMVFSGHLIATASHEGLHALSLYHAHQDKDSGVLLPITDPDQKFVFPNGHDGFPETETTENIMSYTNRRHSIWNWQNKIIHKFLENEK